MCSEMWARPAVKNAGKSSDFRTWPASPEGLARVDTNINFFFDWGLDPRDIKSPVEQENTFPSSGNLVPSRPQ